MQHNTRRAPKTPQDPHDLPRSPARTSLRTPPRTSQEIWFLLPWGSLPVQVHDPNVTPTKSFWYIEVCISDFRFAGWIFIWLAGWRGRKLPGWRFTQPNTVAYFASGFGGQKGSKSGALGVESISSHGFYRLKWSGRKHQTNSLIKNKKLRNFSIVKIQ